MAGGFNTVAGDNTGSPFDFWGDILGGVKDTFGTWLDYKGAKDARRYPTPSQDVYGPPVRDGFASPFNYQKWGLVIAAVGVVLAFLAFRK